MKQEVKKHDPVFQVRETLQKKLKWGEILLTKKRVTLDEANEPGLDADLIIGDDYDKEAVGSLDVFPDGVAYVTARIRVRVEGDGVFDGHVNHMSIVVVNTDTGTTILAKLKSVLDENAHFRQHWKAHVEKNTVAPQIICRLPGNRRAVTVSGDTRIDQICDWQALATNGLHFRMVRESTG